MPTWHGGPWHDPINRPHDVQAHYYRLQRWERQHGHWNYSRDDTLFWVGKPRTRVRSTAAAHIPCSYYWIRAVEDPNFHKYLQTSPTYSTGAAIMADYTTAGQFQIVDGQLVELVDVAKGTLLYANVGQPVNSSDTKLPVTFSKTKNTYGTFQFSGDAVQWSVAGISRPNLSAWLVCGSQQLFVNLGAYGYMTPAGCADETVSRC